MKRRIFAALLAGAMVLSLAACGGGTGGGSSSEPGGSSSGSGVSSSQPGASSSGGSTPDAGGTSGSAGGSASSSVSASGSADGSASSSADGASSSAQGASISLNRTDVTLKTAGSSFNLRYTAEPSGVEVFFSSSDEKVATVDGKGTVTAVGPGTATITAVLGSELAQASCIVRCRWDDSASGGNSSSSGSTSSSDSSSASNVDLQAFYDTTVGKYEFGFLELADDSILDQLYSGLSGVSAEQKLVYITMMSMNNGEFGLVQVKDSKDVDTVKAIFQARIDRMSGADGQGNPGAWYPGPTDQWLNNSRVVSKGNYVMMIVHENCDDIVNDFNALF